MENIAKKPLKHICIGLLAHVDAGKTTLSEDMLYYGNIISSIGRVDKQNTYFDHDEIEKLRGITIYAKQAKLIWENTVINLLDTPGHIDFSTEMERTLSVVDYGILLVDGSKKLHGYTKRLWGLLQSYQIPVFVFVNKMDQSPYPKETILKRLKLELSDGITEFEPKLSEEALENIAVNQEELLEEYLETGTLKMEDIQMAIKNRKTFPCVFGSALGNKGVKELLDYINLYTLEEPEEKEFKGRVYKVFYGKKQERVTMLKVLGGSLKVRDTIEYTVGERQVSEKINELRVYTGEKFEAVPEVSQGEICGICGLKETFPGLGIGENVATITSQLVPVMTYKIVPQIEINPMILYQKLKELEEEEPELQLVWKEETKEIEAKILGQVQMEVLTEVILERYQIPVKFLDGSIIYRETIKNQVKGFGHYEPLRHYAHVELLLEPLERGSGLVFENKCEDLDLEGHFQRLILTHLKEREHLGVLTGSPITDIKITLIGGRAHNKHTEGGDFRQATYRAVRQGLKMAQCQILEPYNRFTLVVPTEMAGVAMTDLKQRFGKMDKIQQREDGMEITGSIPISTLKDYPRMVEAYTQGAGSMTCSFLGYDECHNEEEVLAETKYVFEEDLANPAGSVYCKKGAGYFVPWDEMYDMVKMEKEREEEESKGMSFGAEKNFSIDLEEIEEIISKISYSNGQQKVGKRNSYQKKKGKEVIVYGNNDYKPVKKKEKYILVDGYNIIFAWDELKNIASDNLDGARGKLLDLLCNYQAMKGAEVIAVFDAYRVKQTTCRQMDYHNIHVVFTKEAETADAYIERFAARHGKEYDVWVATSDGLEQMIIRQQGCMLWSAMDFLEEINRTAKEFMEAYESRKEN